MLSRFSRGPRGIKLDGAQRIMRKVFGNALNERRVVIKIITITGRAMREDDSSTQPRT